MLTLVVAAIALQAPELCPPKTTACVTGCVPLGAACPSAAELHAASPADGPRSDLPPRRAVTPSPRKPSPTISVEVARLGRRMEIAGWVLTGLGTFLTVGGLGVIIGEQIDSKTRCGGVPDYLECGSGGLATLVIGGPLLLGGGVFAGVGLPLALVGRRKRTRPPDDLSLGVPGPHRFGAARRGRPTLSLAPTFLGYGGGLAFAGRF